MSVFPQIMVRLFAEAYSLAHTLESQEALRRLDDLSARPLPRSLGERRKLVREVQTLSRHLRGRTPGPDVLAQWEASPLGWSSPAPGDGGDGTLMRLERLRQDVRRTLAETRLAAQQRGDQHALVAVFDLEERYLGCPRRHQDLEEIQREALELGTRLCREEGTPAPLWAG